MKLSLNWLSDFIDLSDVPVEEIVRELTLRTCEVEEHFTVYDHLDSVVLARVLEQDKHPNADRLSLCKVDAGTETLQIVCGAPNVAADMYVPLAKVGARLPLADGNLLEIKVGKIRGEASHGMLCSPKELGLVELTADVDGLLDLEPYMASSNGQPPWATAAGGSKKPARKTAKKAKSKAKTVAKVAPASTPVKLGTALGELFPLKDTIIDIDNKSITHRPDLWSHYGFARELAVIFKRKLKLHPLDAKARAAAKGMPDRKIQIAKGAGHAYHGQHVSGVRIAPSPAWMQARLWNVGQRPLNNVVDATNYLMFEVGQPNHAFDARELKSDTISVATAGAGNIKKFTTLDETERTLPEDTILIMDGSGAKAEAVALGGIMGGLKSGVQDDTTDLFLESATFPRESIRRALSALQLRTESAIRFEKGQDPANAKPALARLVELLALTNPDLKVGKVTGAEPVGPKQSIIKVRAGFLQKRLGIDIKDKEIGAILERLGCTASQDKKGDWKITAPTYRSQYDLTIPEDIVEEVGRIHGLDRIEPSAPLIACAPPPVNRSRLYERRLKNHLAFAGHYHETYNYSFGSKEENELFGPAGLPLANSVSPDRDRMRVSVIPGLLHQAAGNQDRFEEVRLFEFGRVYAPNGKGQLPTEKKRVCLVQRPARARLDVDDGLFQAFLEFRSFIEDTLRAFAPGEPELRAHTGADDIFHPNCAVELIAGGKLVARCGIVSPVREKTFDLKRPALLAEILFDELFEVGDATVRDYAPPSVFPDSSFEFSVVMDRTASTRAPYDLIQELEIPEVREVTLLTIYSGAPLPDDKMSVSFGVRCGLQEGTLSGDQLQQILDRIVGKLADAGYPLR